MRLADEIGLVSGQVRTIQEKLLEIQATCAVRSSVDANDVTELIELLTSTFEELNVASEEVEQQNEELAATRMLVETERQRYRDLFEMAPDGYLVTDADGTIREANHAAGHMLGRRPDHLIGKPLTVFLQPEERRAFRSALIGFGSGVFRDADFPRELELDLHPVGRRPFRAALTVTAIRDHQGRSTGLRWLLRDVTAHYNAEQELSSLNLELEHRVAERTVDLREANRQKEDSFAREREARLEAERAEARLRDLVNGLDAIVWEADPVTLRYISVSEYAVGLLGYPREAWYREGFDEVLIHPDDLAEVRQRRRNALDRRLNEDVEYRVMTREGKTLWIRDMLQVATDAAGAVTGISGVILDITSQHAAARALRESESRLRRLVDANIMGVLFCDHDGVVTSANEAFMSMVGYNELDILDGAVNWGKLTPAEYIPAERRATVEARRRGVFTPFEKEFITKDGRRVPVLVGGAYLDEMHGDFVCFALDLTERKQVLEALRLRDRAIAAALNGVIICDGTDPEMPIVYANPAMVTITGYSASELLGRNPRMLQGAETDRAAVDDLRQAIMYRRPVRTTILNYRKDGTPYWCELSVSPVRGSSGRVTTFIGIIQDVTQRIEAEKEITRLNRDLEKANHQKDRFMAILSHELRTPMTPVIAASQILASRHDLPGDLMPLVDMVARNVGMEVRLIDDLLDMTGIETGKLRLRPELVDLHEVLGGVLEMFQDVVVEKNLRLLLRPDARSHVVEGDPSRLRQVFWNLIRNAVKFTPPGGVVTIVTADEPGGLIRVDVVDTGRGIDPDEAARLFEPFVQGAVAEGEFTGLGLGLAISKSLVELHGGTIVVRSEGPGKGATFSVRLKASPDVARVSSAERAAPLVREHGSRSMRILLVDDHRDTRLVLELLLSSAGHVIHTAESVADAVEKAEREEFDLVISDIGLPDGTGYDLLQRIRERTTVPAIALSGFGMEEDLQKSQRAGFAVHLTKPVTFDQIQSAIDEAIR